MNRSSDNKRSGYVTLLAVTFAFGLATLGTALAVSARSYLASATSRERAILDRISLESVAAQTLADIAAKGERPLQPLQLEAVRINGRLITIELSIPEAKIDLAMDDEAMIRKSFRAFRSRRAVSSVGLEAWARGASLSVSDEDCLRRGATFGRAPETLDETLDEGLPLATLAAGDQMDLRLQLDAGDMERVLWIRARFIGNGGAWRLHDYRALSAVILMTCNEEP